MSLTQRDLQDMVEVIDQRIERRLSQQPYTAYGTVDTVSGQTCSVKVLGNTSPSFGFRIPSEWGVVSGDRVRVTINPAGDRYVNENLTANRPAATTSAVTVGNLTAGVITSSGGLNVVRTGNPSLELRSTDGGLPFIDLTNDAGSDYDARLILNADGSLSMRAGGSGSDQFVLGTDGLVTYRGVGRRVRRTTAQSIAANTWIRVSGYSITDYAGLGTTWNPYGAGEIRVDVPGFYLIVGRAGFVGNASGDRRIIACSFGFNATPSSNPDPSDETTYIIDAAARDIHMLCVYLVHLDAGNTVALNVHQNGTAAINISDAALSIARVGGD